jgi:hypothetical protein
MVKSKAARVNGSSSLGRGTSGVGNFAVVLRRVIAASIDALPLTITHRARLPN